MATVKKTAKKPANKDYDMNKAENDINAAICRDIEKARAKAKKKTK